MLRITHRRPGVGVRLRWRHVLHCSRAAVEPGGRAGLKLSHHQCKWLPFLLLWSLKEWKRAFGQTHYLPITWLLGIIKCMQSVDMCNGQVLRLAIRAHALTVAVATSSAPRLRLDVHSCGVFAFVRALLLAGALFVSFWAAVASAAVLADCLLSCTQPRSYFRHKLLCSPQDLTHVKSILCRSLYKDSMRREVSEM